MRINNFMNMDGINFNAVTHHSNNRDSVAIESGNFSWEPQEEPILKNININVKKGSLVAVVGIIGSGKSTFLSAILGEIEKVSGHVNTTGSITYVSQQAWIRNETLRDNILFGKPWNSTLYKRVLKDCALESDLATLPAGDATEIGEKGINLSGGQKQRVSLARAVYNNADIYLLDDSLSAVDSHVGKFIFDNVLGPNGTLRKRTRVLVTHGIAFLSQVDNIIVMKDGLISEVGTYLELLQKDHGDFGEFLKEHTSNEAVDDNHDLRNRSLARKEPVHEESVTDVQNGRKMSINSMRRPSRSDSTVGRKIMSVEMCEEDCVKSTVYLEYFRASGWPLFATTLILFFIFQCFVIASNFWLSYWTNHLRAASNGTTIETEEHSSNRDYYLVVYGALGLGQAIAILVASYVQSVGALKSAEFLHMRMLTRIMRAPLWFFETTPLGRIFNRFSKDVDMIDTKLPVFIRRELAFIFEVFGVLVIICYTFPIFNIVIIPIGAIYYLTQHLYVATSRQLTRLDSVSRSPIYSHFEETLSGVSTIRAYRMQEYFIKESVRKNDENLKNKYPKHISARWIEMRLEFIGNTIVLLAALFTVIWKKSVDEGLAGLALSSALVIVKSLSGLAYWTSEVEGNIVSVERLKEYGECPQESSWEIVEVKPPMSWPDKGVIEFNNYQTRYRDGLQLCLKGITCRIEEGEKIGIVGRTGAGKSSFALSLFRIIEPTEGTIRIDGVDIRKIGLHDLRRRITVIPQDPTLFSGKLRLNLDPESMLPDDKLWRALELAHLKGLISTLPDGLDHEMSEGGENFSVGQRQLVCLARALLRKTKVLILDEATASVDLDTDALIQETIRAEFSDTTVLTIAHRINTIMDSTRVLVLDKGEICELDTPSNLLQSKSSVFYSLAKEAGLV